MRWNEWVTTGRHIDGGGHQIWHRVDGEDGRWTTFFHGFPTSSYDWHQVLPLLPGGRRRLLIDHLGFGASDKPAPYPYSFDEQIEIAKAIWQHHGIEETTIVAHDYSVSMVQEILARFNQDAWDGPRIAGVALLNGGLAYSRQKRLPIQTILRTPVIGPLAGRFTSRRAFDDAMGRILHPDHHLDEAALGEHWRSIAAARGVRAIPYVSRYHGERRANEQRWLGALQHAARPIRMLWGDADPVSGRTMADHIAHQTRTIRIVRWDDVGHYPQLEVPDRIAAHIAQVERYQDPTAVTWRA